MTARGKAAHHPAQRPAASGCGSASFRSDEPMPRIAALEDDEAQARVLLDWLAAEGYPVRWYSSGRTLMRELKREQPDLLLLDWEMPQMSGTDVLRWVHANIETRLPAIFVTSAAPLPVMPVPRRSNVAAAGPAEGPLPKSMRRKRRLPRATWNGMLRCEARPVIGRMTDETGNSRGEQDGCHRAFESMGSATMEKFARAVRTRAGRI